MIFPESRHSNVGTTAYLPKNLGKLVKLLGVPLVTVSVHGSYLANPFWDENHTRKVPMEVTVEGKGADALKIHIPDWYEWQREEAINMYKGENPFARSFKVHVEALPNEKGFVDLGFGNVELNSHEFVLRMQDVKGEKMTLRFPHHIRESLQTEYDYRNKGMCIVLSTRDCCYYLYSEEKEFQVTELQFISEYLFQNS